MGVPAVLVATINDRQILWFNWLLLIFNNLNALRQ